MPLNNNVDYKIFGVQGKNEQVKSCSKIKQLQDLKYLKLFKVFLAIISKLKSILNFKNQSLTNY